MILLPSPVFVGYSGYFVLAVLCFSIIAFGQRQRQRQLTAAPGAAWHAAATGYPST